MAKLDDYTQRAREIQDSYKREVEGWRKSPDHTKEAKEKFIALAENKRRQAVADLQAEAQAAIVLRRATVERAHRQAAEKHLAERRALLGDAILADIFRRSVETLDPADIAAAYQAAPTQWEREVIAGYGLPLLQMRARTNPSGDVLKALGELNQAEPEPMRQAAAELRDLDYDARRLDELDRESYNAEIADRMGVRAEFLE